MGQRPQTAVMQKYIKYVWLRLLMLQKPLFKKEKYYAHNNNIYEVTNI
jgi:hypothetical protein